MKSGTTPRRVSAANIPTCTAPRLPPPASTNAVEFFPCSRMALADLAPPPRRHPVFGGLSGYHALRTRSDEDSISRKPAFTCEPSQKGFLREWPQRQNATLGPHGERISPPLLTSVSDPSTMQGPFVA